MKERGIITGSDLLKCLALERMTELYGSEGTSRDPQVPDKAGSLQRPCWQASRQVLSISREGNSTPSLGSLFQFLVTLRAKEFFPRVPAELPMFQKVKPPGGTRWIICSTIVPYAT